MSQVRLTCIAAIDEHGAIGNNGHLLCHLPSDLQRLRQLTLNHTVIMGRKTFENLPHKPLPQRNTIVLTRQAQWHHDSVVTLNWDEQMPFMQVLQPLLTQDTKDIYVLGGGEIYRKLLPYCSRLILTHIHHHWEETDTSFPIINGNEWKLIAAKDFFADAVNIYDYTLEEYVRIN